MAQPDSAADAAPSDQPKSKNRTSKAKAVVARVAKRLPGRRPAGPHNPHRAFRLTPRARQKQAMRDVRAGWRLLKDSWQFLKQHRRLLGTIGFLYAVVAYVAVGGVSLIEYSALRGALAEAADGSVITLGNILTLFGSAVGVLNRPTSDLQRFLSGLLTIYFWLALVWASRMLMAGKAIAVRDALYSCAAPLAPVFLLLLLMAVQMLPSALGIFAYAIAAGGLWLYGGIESMVFGVIAILLTILSLYWIINTLVAMVIATLPGIYPMRALREARELVAGRRWRLLVRMLVAGVTVSLVWLAVLLPVVLLDAWINVAWLPLVMLTVQLLAGATLVFVSVYTYKLYRSLL